MAESNEVMQALQKLLEQRTFSVEAAEGIAKLREENSSLKARIESANSRAETNSNEASRLRSELEATKNELKALREREGKIIEHEKAVAVANAKVEMAREMSGLIFRNTEIRRAAFGTVAPAASANPNYYPPASIPVNNTETESVG
jgi:predicted  nucleic acid-binding Zn-ribbon protein